MSYKTFDLDKDFYTNQYFLNEGYRFFKKFLSGSSGDSNINIPNHFVTGGVSGSYFIEIYDKTKSDISSNKLLTMTYGHSTSSIYYSGAFNATYQEPKLKMYRLMAKRLLGAENKKFTIDGKELNEAIFLCVSRNQYKDFIVPKTTQLWYYLTGSPGAENEIQINYLYDFDSKIDNEFAGNFTILKNNANQVGAGLMFSKAGICVIDPKILATSSFWSGSQNFEQLAKGVSGTTYNDLLWALKHRVYYWDFSGSSKVESSFYICNAKPDEFNYSSNPSFTSNNGEIITSMSSSSPTCYITQVGLLGVNQEIIAVGKLNRPVKKNPHLGTVIITRLDT